jgi:hypothetical protein
MPALLQCYNTTAASAFSTCSMVICHSCGCCPSCCNQGIIASWHGSQDLLSTTQTLDSVHSYGSNIKHQLKVRPRTASKATHNNNTPDSTGRQQRSSGLEVVPAITRAEDVQGAPPAATALGPETNRPPCNKPLAAGPELSCCPVSSALHSARSLSCSTKW